MGILLKAGCLVGLTIGSAVMWYQASLLNKEWRQLEEARDRYQILEQECRNNPQLQETVAMEEELKQLKQVKEGLLLDKDVLTQLKVNLQFKLQQKAAG